MHSFLNSYFKVALNAGLICFLILAIYTFFHDVGGAVAEGTKGVEYTFLVFALFFLFQVVQRGFVGSAYNDLDDIFDGKRFGVVTKIKAILSLIAGIITFFIAIYILGVAPYYDTYPGILDSLDLRPPEKSIFDDYLIGIIFYVAGILLLGILAAGLAIAYFFYGIGLTGVGVAISLHNWQNGRPFELGAIFDALLEVSLSETWSVVILAFTFIINLLDGRIKIPFLGSEE
jgi:hypothetical protein